MGGGGLGRPFWIDDDLRQPIAIAQVDEDQFAIVAPVPDPAGQRHRAADIGRGEITTRDGAQRRRPERRLRLSGSGPACWMRWHAQRLLWLDSSWRRIPWKGGDCL